ncbi:hypothetical protein INT47_011087 [Mucor saturninus]|uniref:Peptidase S54 rhomboid domain-containing protein n=1 Tax=Mucor saturninus TaxID=64648 RepID=A0A8H7REU8_9FUNG|nr:hypothetical protein INT47_011087 [Mucor saturninus]
MEADGPSGFRNAPVTKFLVPIVGGCSALAAVLNAKPHMVIQLSQLTMDGQFWKLFTSHWAFGSIGTSVVGTWLIYKMKIVERRYGSSKYAALVFISFVASTLLQTGALVSGLGFIKSIASGPYAILFSIMYQFQKIVPASHQTSMLGLKITDKTYVYLAAAQLFLSSSSASIIPCVCGIIVGAIYDQTRAKTWRFPQWIQRFGRNYLSPLLTSKSKKKPSRQPTTANVRPRSAPAPPIDEGDIDIMLGMFPNYTRQDIKNALIKSKSDLNRAAEILLTTEPSASGSQ